MKAPLRVERRVERGEIISPIRYKRQAQPFNFYKLIEGCKHITQGDALGFYMGNDMMIPTFRNLYIIKIGNDIGDGTMDLEEVTSA